jgi:precorrin-6B methylase 2
MNVLHRGFSLLVLLAFAATGCAQAPAYEPESGQPGKDVVWVPTSQALVDKMLDIAKVTPQDIVMDLGSGDGRTVITAAKRGARASGIEYNPDMVALSQKNAEKEGVAGKAKFIQADLFESDFSQATVITMFLLPSINVKLRPRILALKPGTRVVSNSFTMDTWEPDETHNVSREAGCQNAWCTALLWIVPGKFAGSYAIPEGQLVLDQQFQQLSGRLVLPGGASRPVSGKIRGEDAFFTIGGKAYRARMDNGQLVLQ